MDPTSTTNMSMKYTNEIIYKRSCGGMAFTCETEDLFNNIAAGISQSSHRTPEKTNGVMS